MQRLLASVVMVFWSALLHIHAMPIAVIEQPPQTALEAHSAHDCDDRAPHAMQHQPCHADALCCCLGLVAIGADEPMVFARWVYRWDKALDMPRLITQYSDRLFKPPRFILPS
jgi:hypothetical protein